MNFSSPSSYKQIRGDGFIKRNIPSADRMVTLLITSALIVGLFAVAIYLWQKPANNIETLDLPPADPPRALFSDSQPVAELTPTENDGHADLLARVTNGDLNALAEAKKLNIYDDALNVLLEGSSQAQLLSVATHVAANDLPANRVLVEAIMQFWESSPDSQTTAKMLHIASLTDNAEIYEMAVQRVLSFWRDGKLPELSATELQALFNSQFWLLSSEVRSSGTGFVLKRTLSSARRELEGTTNN